MLNRTTAIAVLTAAVFALGMVAVAQTNGVSERFTFMVANASKVGPAGADRLELVVNRWADEAERDRVLSILRDNGADKLGEAVCAASDAGYLHWPGYLDYIVRYAQRIPRPDGGEDVVLARDRPIWLWWESASATPAQCQSTTVIQLRLNKDGRGEGKVSLATKVNVNNEAKTFTLEDYAKQPVVMTDV